MTTTDTFRGKKNLKIKKRRRGNPAAFQFQEEKGYGRDGRSRPRSSYIEDEVVVVVVEEVVAEPESDMAMPSSIAAGDVTSTDVSVVVVVSAGLEQAPTARTAAATAAAANNLRIMEVPSHQIVRGM